MFPFNIKDSHFFECNIIDYLFLNCILFDLDFRWNLDICHSKLCFIWYILCFLFFLNTFYILYLMLYILDILKILIIYHVFVIL